MATTDTQLQGLLLIDKPKGWTSFDVVNYVRKQVAVVNGTKPKNTKVGHTGTLDPLATGLLVLLVGKTYTRKATTLTKLDKTYLVTMKLGEVSTTGDGEGEKQPISNTVPSEAEVRAALATFQGDILQVPPAFSAMKINGQRAYKLARPVTIYSNELTSYDYPYVTFTSAVGSGTYIRSLVADLGKTLKTGAYMSDLCRSQVGNFRLEDASLVTADMLLEKLQPVALP
jgi:tRNA pseudouridine55 synthase